MIDELKLILDAIGDIGPYAIAVVFGFFVYKTALYLGSVGVLYKGITMAMSKVHDYKIKQIDAQNTKAEYEHQRAGKPKEYNFGGILIDEAARNELLTILNDIRQRRIALSVTSRGTTYIHASDLRVINKIITLHYYEESRAADKKA